MNQAAIFGPFFAMIALVFVVWVYLYITTNQVHGAYLAGRGSSWPSARLSRIERLEPHDEEGMIVSVDGAELHYANLWGSASSEPESIR